MDRHTRANLKVWDRLVEINFRSRLYDVEGFVSGKSSLSSIEVKEIGGKVAGKSVLHLQCHFGMDTLSLVRLGAKSVTGVDFSPVAIARARTLAKETHLEGKAEFLCSDVYELPRTLARRFDFVYTGGGTLFWLKDLERWGKIVASALRPKGRFYIAEFHPFANVFDEEAPSPSIRYPYSHGKHPIISKVHGAYSEPKADFHGEEHGWGYGMGELVGSLIDAGLRIDFLHEFDSVGYKRFPFLKKRKDGRWTWKDPSITIPLVFSLLATKM